MDSLASVHPNLAAPILHKLPNSYSLQYLSPLASLQYVSNQLWLPCNKNHQPPEAQLFFPLVCKFQVMEEVSKAALYLSNPRMEMLHCKQTPSSSCPNYIMPGMAEAFVDKVLSSCLQCHKCPMLSRVFQGHLAALHLFSLLLLGPFLFLFVFFSFLCMPIINFLLGPALCDPWVFLGAPLGIPSPPALLIDGFSSPATNILKGIYAIRCSTPKLPEQSLEKLLLISWGQLQCCFWT